MGAGKLEECEERFEGLQCIFLPVLHNSASEAQTKQSDLFANAGKKHTNPPIHQHTLAAFPQ